MIGIGLKLLGVGRKLVSGAVSLVVKYPLQAALIVLLCVTVWALRSRAEMRGERDTARTQLTQWIKAEGEARKLAEAQLKARETYHREKAHEADVQHREQLAAGRSATDRFIASRRVQPARSCTAQAAPAAEGGSAGVPAEVPADTVVVDVADVRVCGDLYAYAVAAHNWAKTINEGR